MAQSKIHKILEENGYRIKKWETGIFGGPKPVFEETNPKVKKTKKAKES